MDPIKETTPDELMSQFRGRSMKSMVLFTVVVHVVIIFGSSVPWLMKLFIGDDVTKLDENARMELAVKEATSSLRKIAESHGLQPQQLGDRIKGGNATAPAPKDSEEPAKPEEPAAQPPPETTTPDPQPPTTPERPKSEIEKQLEKKVPGPTTPPIDEAEDLFKVK